MKKLFSFVLFVPIVFVFSVKCVAQVPRTAFVHLFEWQWNDIAQECENVLGPKGYAAVQVSPPQKSIEGDEWYTRYQPLSYAIEGRSGSRQEFADMVARCKAVGVDIYVDAVINHMAARDRNYPDVPYGFQDFHDCRVPINYQDRFLIQNCDLVGLNDLRTESEYVRGRIADYLNDLISLGVAGFRIDASKHIPSNDIAAILDRLGGSPYIFQEVIGAFGEPVQPPEYLGNGDVTEFNYERAIGEHFKARSPLRNLLGIENRNGWLSSSDAVVFVANHDDQRQNTFATLTFFDQGNLYNLGHIFMLAYPYGYPKVMSSYFFETEEQGPPRTGASRCDNGWLCEHRNRGVANMVAFRNNTADAFFISDQWDNGNNQIAFGRGDKGFVVINREDGTLLNRTFRTRLEAGEYCDVVNGDFDFDSGVCDGPTVEVSSSGDAFFSVGSLQASAIHVGARVGVPCPECGGNTPVVNPPGANSCAFETMNLRGTFNSFENLAMRCEANEWVATATFASDSNARFKFDVFGDWSNNYGDNNRDGIADGNGDDIAIEQIGTYEIRFNDRSLAYTLSRVETPGEGPGGDRVSVTFTCNNATTRIGQSVYVVGNQAALGNWNIAEAVKLDPIAYPSWSASIALNRENSVQWKCLKRDENDPMRDVIWQPGANNVLNPGAGATSVEAGF